MPNHIQVLGFGWHIVINLFSQSYMQTLIVFKIGINQNYYTFTLILLMHIVLCGQFPWTEFINHKCFEMKSSCSSSSSMPWSIPSCSSLITWCLRFGGEVIKIKAQKSTRSRSTYSVDAAVERVWHFWGASGAKVRFRPRGLRPNWFQTEFGMTFVIALIFKTNRQIPASSSTNQET